MHCQTITSITATAAASISVNVNDNAISRSRLTETAEAKRCFVAGGNIQCARLMKMNGRKSSHTARLAGPEVSPPHEYASSTLRHAPGGPAVASSIHGLSSVETRRLVAGDFLEEFGGATQQRFGRCARHSVHPQLHDGSAGGHPPILTRGLAIGRVGTPVETTNLKGPVIRYPWFRLGGSGNITHESVRFDDTQRVGMTMGFSQSSEPFRCSPKAVRAAARRSTR